MAVIQILKNLKYLLLSKSYPLWTKKSQSIEPFFIVGSGRSGNTLLRKILDKHSELFIPPETYELGVSIDQFKKFNKIGWNNIVKLIYANFQFNPDFNTFSIPSLDKLYQKVIKYEQSNQSLADILDAFYEEYKYRHDIKAKRWGDKTPLNTMYMNEIFEVFSNAKFIHIIRNPYDAIYSYVNSGIYTNYYDATQRWKTSIEKATLFGKEYPNSYHEVEYEKLVNQPKIYISRICTFLDIEYEESMIEEDSLDRDLGDVNRLKHHENVLKIISNEYIGKGIKNLSEEELFIINQILRQSKNEIILERILL